MKGREVAAWLLLLVTLFVVMVISVPAGQQSADAQVGPTSSPAAVQPAATPTMDRLQAKYAFATSEARRLESVDATITASKATSVAANATWTALQQENRRLALEKIAANVTATVAALRTAATARAGR